MPNQTQNPHGVTLRDLVLLEHIHATLPGDPEIEKERFIHFAKGNRTEEQAEAVHSAILETKQLLISSRDKHLYYTDNRVLTHFGIISNEATIAAELIDRYYGQITLYKGELWTFHGLCGQDNGIPRSIENIVAKIHKGQTLNWPENEDDETIEAALQEPLPRPGIDELLALPAKIEAVKASMPSKAELEAMEPSIKMLAHMAKVLTKQHGASRTDLQHFMAPNARERLAEQKARKAATAKEANP